MSLNIPSIKLAEKVGVMNVIKLARDMGIQSPLEPSYALALGVSELTLLELASAYGTFANNGLWVKPSAIIKIEDQKGHVIYENKIEERKVLDENIAAVMVDLMKGVLLRGTGIRGRLEREAAAKTGTTEEFRDAWFIGYVPQLVAGVWVGNDNNKSMKGVAEVSVCPRLWKMFMQTAIANEPVQRFPRPKGLVKIKICIDSGLPPNEFCPPKRVIEESFWLKTKPSRKCDFHKSDTPEQAIPMEQIEIEEGRP
jgi:penicillin-binding protein 1A